MSRTKNVLSKFCLLKSFLFLCKKENIMNIQQIKDDRDRLKHSLNLLIAQIGPIQIGSVKQFPFGWRKAAKGRTVWRIIEEAITQNIEKHYRELSIDNVHISDSEVSVYDMSCTYAHNKPIYINIKSAVIGGKKNKDDISKAEGLVNFYKQDPDRNFFVATFFIKFNANMTIEIVRAVVFPIAWIKDIYVNPSNNGNLQSAYYKDLNDAIYRTNEEFLPLFYQAVELAAAKKKKKQEQ